MSRPRIGSLFSGMGMLDAAVEEVFGAELTWYADCCKFDKDGNAGHHEPHRAPCSIMAHHYPDVPNHGDVTRIDWAAVEPVDIITGGSPCQDLSHAGKRAGMTEGTRSNLWVAMREAIAVIRPRYVIWENVRGASSACAESEADSDLGRCPRCVDSSSGAGHAPNLRALGRVVGDMADLGYVGCVRGLRAADVGAPHERFRYFMLGVAADAADLGHQWTRGARDGGAGPADGRLLATGRVLATPTASIAEGGRPQDSRGKRDLRLDLLPTPTTRDHKGRNQRDDESCLTGALLPTPRATDGTKGGPNQRGSSGDLMLPSAVMLLPTPSVADGTGGHTTRSGARSGELLLPGVAKALALLPTPRATRGGSATETVALLPTPAVNDMGAGKTVEAWDAWTADMQAKHANGNGHGKSLSIEAQRLAVTTLLPTPRTKNNENRQSEAYAHGEHGGNFHRLVTGEAQWGDYGVAIERWEAITRPAPAPTVPDGKNGAHRLNPRFVEWLMGCPDGWVCDVPGITRNEALKALGNGVVRQQAVAALRWSLARLERVAA